MLLTKDDFQTRYGGLYESALREAENYVANPQQLRDETEATRALEDPMAIRGPVPDPFSYRMMRYRGFTRFPERLRNFIVASNEARSTVRSFMPTMIDVEPVSRCNFRCIMCTVSDWDYGQRAEDLTFDQFKQFVENHPYILEMKLQGIGEPLLHRHFIDMVQYLAERDIWVRTTVNGSLLHARDNYQRLIDSGVGEVQASFDRATKEVFEQVRRRSNFDLVVRNLTLLNNYANQKDRPHTRMWVLVQKHNRHQLFDFVELAKRMGFRRLTYSVSLGDWGKEKWHQSNLQLQSSSVTQEEEQELAHLAASEGIEITLWGSAATYSTESPESLCPAPFFRASVSSDGRLVPCCRVGNPEVFDLGAADDFQQAWNG